uniref:Basement membrane-specific heparan sulfate proteoglycan core protein n=1 Tax=Astyanax mexicanus TaxID=7994 RepID=A0A8B9RME3_ASTMX
NGEKVKMNMYININAVCLFPAVLNLASMAKITANATCGEKKPEMFCKLVEHVPGQPVRNPQCRVCNLKSERPYERHPIEYAIDGTNKWWQSPSIKNGMEYHYVTITLDLQQVFQIAYFILKAANSPRPGNWILERSLDGENFTPWQYYAITDTECITRFNIPPRTGPPGYRRDDEVICTSFYSKIHPLENGEIHTSLINGRPSADDPSPTLLNFTTARYIRLKFLRIRTLNADLMTLALNDPLDIDPIVTRRYYYSIKDISVGGMCICYGHAKACPLNLITKKLSCECEHNTCGESCDRCCPGYNQKPWMAGTFLTRHVCEKCNCHGKSEECYYNQTVADGKLSLNVNGEYEGGGVCRGCSENTAGVNCQSCTDGYYRPRGSCPCKETYTFATLRSLNCCFSLSFSLSLSLSLFQDNVEGVNCDRCKMGFYNLHGDGFHGCEKCYCSGVASNCEDLLWKRRSVSVEVASEGSSSDVQASAVEVCTCPFGYSGTSCESCAEGYRRINGTAYQGVCELCQCHGHAAHCDEVTGYCLGCEDHTTGPHCDKCAPGYYGDATKGTASDCQPCACPLNAPSNNFSPTCHQDARGQMICDRCQPGYTGPRCDRCDNGYFGRPSVLGGSCRPCECNDNLDLSTDRSCDPVTGECLRCREGYGGPVCDTCADGYYGDAIFAKDCQPCRCNINGSVSEVCNKQNGQCECRQNAIGRQCDECMPGAHMLPGGCVPCNCNSFGSKSFDCGENGQCRCQPGVTGQKCDRCAPGHFNFQEGGCTPCQCAHVGNNCDSTTGQCICPPNTIGERCDRCAPNHWGYDITTGCKPCGCNVLGSVSQQCNMNTGCCTCQERFVGEKCTECKLGFRDFPQCMSCDCTLAGSTADTCDSDSGLCACADRTGQCSCKANVEGVRCSSCKAGTFGLSVSNPLGCSHCYCFGMSQSCTEAQGLIRMRLTLMPEQTVLPLVDRTNVKETTVGMTFQHPEIIANADLVRQEITEPFYWRLPKQFRGSMITAYGGKLKYAIYYEARDETGQTSYEPQVIIKGGPNRDKVMVRHMSAPQIGQLTRHEIDMTEVSKPMTREDFMDVLFYIEYILIRASHGNVMRQSRISEIALVVAEEGRPSVESERAFQIEKCDCPQGYSGLSCEECAAGFYRLSVKAGGPASRAGIGSCVRCQCNGHSNTCDPETSICQVSLQNTAVDHTCERCVAGYYGIVRGSPEDCKPCACPLTNPENNFSPTCVAQGFGDYRCTACPVGYDGKHCERCAAGYHGDPRKVGGKCEECKCDVVGAWPVLCDTHTGQCQCRPGATGLKCDHCMENVVIVTEVCVCVAACDDDCAGLLIRDMDKLLRLITSANLTLPLPPPYKMLYRFENMTEELKVGVFFVCVCVCVCVCFCSILAEAKNLSFNATAAFNAYTNIKNFIDEADKAAREAKATATEAVQLVRKHKDGFLETNTIYLFHGNKNKYLRPNGSPLVDTEFESLQCFDWFHVLRVCVCVCVVHAAGAKVKDLEDEADRLLEKLKPIQQLQDNLRKNISQIKELINQARKQANSIKVSVSSGGDCIRAYRPDIKKGRYNTIILNVKTVAADNLLFYLGSVDFLALEMRKGKVNFLWDVGSGVGRVEYPDLVINDGNWHRIEASRVGLNGSISVRALEGPKAGIMPTWHSANGPESFTVLDVDQNAYLFVGGMLGSIKKADAVKTITFSGCMGETFLDGKPIGLWNYREREGDCKGCVVRYTHSYSTHTQTHTTFRNMGPPPGLHILYCTCYTKDFMSIELSDGRVKVSYDLGSGTGSVISDKRHNDGKWKSLTINDCGVCVCVCVFLRSFSVQVDEEPRLEQALPSDQSIILHRLFIGGVPDDVQTGLQRPSMPFEGCIWNLLINTVYVAFTCWYAYVQFIKCIFCVCPSLSLVIEFDLRTEADSGLVFYMARINHADFATIQVKEGMAHLSYDLGSGNTSVSVPRIINDGQWHKIRVRRDKQRGILTVDNRYSKHTVSPKKADILDVVGMLYVGGLPLNYTTKRIGPVVYSINGCIKNFRMLNVDMENPTSSYRVGSCFVNPQPGSYFDGTGYAKAVATYRVGNDVSVDLEFRTSTSSGVLLGISSQKMDGLGIELVNGKLLFHADNGGGRVTAVYEPPEEAGLCDGQWHSVTAHKLKHRVELIIDGVKSEAAGPDPRSATADTIDPIYVGGYPGIVIRFLRSSEKELLMLIRLDNKVTKPSLKSFDSTNPQLDRF